MNEQNTVEEAVQNSKDYAEVDIGRLVRALWRRAWILVLAVILGGTAAFVWTKLRAKPVYKSSIQFYVNNSNPNTGNSGLGVSAGDLNASKSLVDSYIVILKTKGTLLQVIEQAGVDYSVGALGGMVSAKAVDETEIFDIVVTCGNPQDAEKIINAIAVVLPKRIAEIIEGTTAKVADDGALQAVYCPPSYRENTVMGAMVLLLLCAGVIVLVEFFDVTIKQESDIARSCQYPLLAAVPDAGVPVKVGSYYGYDRENKTGVKLQQEHTVMGKDISFAAAEAYKLLCTKIQYSFADDKKCRVIAVASALAGEGKSTSAVNLADTLAQFNERVLLIDCDLRRPTMAEKLSLKKKPGLSDYLTGTMNMNDLFQRYSSDQDKNLFYVITAGPNPPNPVELLNSAKMEKLLQSVSELFDYIILDVPPIHEVTDALVVSTHADGVLLVVRENYCNRHALREAVQQFEFIGTRILGVLVNCSAERANHRYGYRKRGYRKYGYRKYGYRKYYDRTSATPQNKSK